MQHVAAGDDPLSAADNGQLVVNHTGAKSIRQLAANVEETAEVLEIKNQIQIQVCGKWRN